MAKKTKVAAGIAAPNNTARSSANLDGNSDGGGSEAVKGANGLAINFDAAEFVHFLEDTGWTETEKAEYASLVWNIICEFVAHGWGVHPMQQAQGFCGKGQETEAIPALQSTDVIKSSHGNLIDEFVRRNGESADSGRKEGESE